MIRKLSHRQSGDWLVIDLGNCQGRRWVSLCGCIVPPYCTRPTSEPDSLNVVHRGILVNLCDDRALTEASEEDRKCLYRSHRRAIADLHNECYRQEVSARQAFREAIKKVGRYDWLGQAAVTVLRGMTPSPVTSEDGIMLMPRFRGSYRMAGVAVSSYSYTPKHDMPLWRLEQMVADQYKALTHQWRLENECGRP